MAAQKDCPDPIVGLGARLKQSLRSALFQILFLIVCDRVLTSSKFTCHVICISRVLSCVFHVHLDVVFLDLELQKNDLFLHFAIRLWSCFSVIVIANCRVPKSRHLKFFWLIDFKKLI